MDGDEVTGVGRPTRLGRLSRRARSMWASGVRLWRTSLQFRVVLTTMLVGSALTLILQSFLYYRVADGLVAARSASAEAEAAYGAEDIRAGLESTDRTDLAGIQQVAFDFVNKQQSQSPDRNRRIVLVRALNNASGPASAGPSGFSGIPVRVIPDELRKQVVEEPSHLQSQVAMVPLNDQTWVSGVIVGTLIQIPEAGAYELYYVFPMEREREIMEMVWRVFLVGSIALVATLGLVAFIVTRLVVDPLRQASEVAGRLSSGHLNERMLVRGEDDIARLAAAFNDMAEHLQEQIRRLEDLSRVQQRFVSDVSHELRTPLTTIHMASELIHEQRDSFDPVVARSTELLHTQVERFEELLADLLEISRFDAGGAALDLESVDLRVPVTRAIAGAEHLAAAKGSEIVVVGDDVAHVAAIDTRRVDRILRNLLVNAVEHGEGRPVTVEMGSDEESVAVVVADSGIGLRPGEADLVFNRFWRADPSRKRTTGGTGLGLAISLEDAHLHRGTLQAWGAPGRGARFRLTLPRGSGQVVTGSPLPLEPPPSPDDAPGLPEIGGGQGDAATAVGDREGEPGAGGSEDAS